MHTFGDILPLALGVAISPMPVIATILTLMSRRARSTSTAFALGWMLCIAVLTVLLSVLGSLLPPTGSASGGIVRAIAHLLLGLLLGWLAIRAFRKRPKRDEEPAMPKWMASALSFTPWQAFGTAMLIGAANPKNILLIGGAAVALSESSSVSGALVAGTVFVVVASMTVLLPVIAFLIAAERVTPVLAGMHEWLARNNGTIIAAILLILAASSIGKGIDAL